MPRKNPAAVALGRRGGKAKSERKAASSRENGKKGGRPVEKPKQASKRPGFIARASKCPRCGMDVSLFDVIGGRCGECRLAEDEADWADEAEGPLN
jgi:hypothetical protein